MAEAKDERRIHARIEVDLPCTVFAPDGLCAGRIRDISAGGAQVVAPADVAAVGGELEFDLKLPGHGEPIAIRGQVRRVSVEGQSARYGVQFGALDDARRRRVRAFLDALVVGVFGGGEGREGPRLSRRVAVVCATPEETQATMTNISRGGLAIYCPTKLAFGEEVTVEVRVDRFPEALELRGWVAHQRQTDDGEYRVGIRFAALSPERRRTLDELMRFLARVGSR